MKTNWLTNKMLVQIFLLCFLFTSGFAAMELPSKLSQVPIYSGSKIVQVMDMGNSSMASLEAKTDSDTLIKFYKKEMQDKGWKAAFQAEQADTAVIHFTKDNQTIQISTNKGEQGALLYQMVFIGQ
jgi:hypothetical protein